MLAAAPAQQAAHTVRTRGWPGADSKTLTAVRCSLLRLCFHVPSSGQVGSCDALGRSNGVVHLSCDAASQIAAPSMATANKPLHSNPCTNICYPIRLRACAQKTPILRPHTHVCNYLIN